MNNIREANKIIQIAFQFHSQGNIEMAKKYYENFIRNGFKHHIVFSNYGVILRDLGKLKEAEIFTRKAIELNPNFANAHLNLGGIYKDLGKLKEAEMSYLALIELNPNLAEAHANLGNLYKDLGKLKEAEISTRKAIELNPNLAEAHANLGNLYKDLGKLKEAEISTRRAIKLNPNFANAHYNLGTVLFDLGKLKEAEISTRKAIELNPNFANAHLNLGGIYKELSKLKEAKISTRKAIELNPNLAEAHSNMGNIFRNLGKLKEAEISTRKAIELNPDFAAAYFSLSTLKSSFESKKLLEQLFSKNILNNKLKKEKISIYFARANILHNESNFNKSSKYLNLANNLKNQIYSSNVEYLINLSKLLQFESNKEIVDCREIINFPENIFIVGMPRSGSTLLESIISMNIDVDDLGEINILEESFLSWKKSDQKLTLSEFYLKQIKIYCSELKSITNKWLYNYQYSGIIARHIPNAKIIHCFRNPFDNILSIYRANFSKGNEYSTSLVDCAKVYLNQDEIMTQYKKRFNSKIYDLNYDLLVSNPDQEIKSLISWLGWKWDDCYLSPHLNPRSVSTASSVQVRFPINSKSVGGWKNYKVMLKPAMKIITQKNKYKNLKY